MPTNKEFLSNQELIIEEELWDDINSYAESVLREIIPTSDTSFFNSYILERKIRTITPKLIPAEIFGDIVRNTVIIEVLGHIENAPSPDLEGLEDHPEEQKARIIFLAYLEAEVREKIKHIKAEIQGLVDYASDNAGNLGISDDHSFDADKIKIYPKITSPFSKYIPSDNGTMLGGFFIEVSKYDIYSEIMIEGSKTTAITYDVEEHTIAFLWIETTEVIFRKHTDTNIPDQILAVMPYAIATDNDKAVMCYSEPSGHGGCRLDIIKGPTVPATEEEYSKLRRKMEEVVGFTNIKVIQWEDINWERHNSVIQRRSIPEVYREVLKASDWYKTRRDKTDTNLFYRKGRKVNIADVGTLMQWLRAHIPFPVKVTREEKYRTNPYRNPIILSADKGHNLEEFLPLITESFETFNVDILNERNNILKIMIRSLRLISEAEAYKIFKDFVKEKSRFSSFQSLKQFREVRSIVLVQHHFFPHGYPNGEVEHAFSISFSPDQCIKGKLMKGFWIAEESLEKWYEELRKALEIIRSIAN